ncbi:MAG TPA: hypothetical protein VFH68_18705 [Polyangia bacterium]|jgi:hypothetical protein|nr:hypothetical protein [Polyangia bacterium]
MSQGSFDPSKRRLCPDGACIGVIGDDGRCRVCGRTGVGTGSAPASASARADIDQTDDLDAWGGDGGDEPEREADTAQAVAGGAGDFRPDRPLCDDGSCIGVVGDDGRCSVCGRAQGGGE